MERDGQIQKFLVLCENSSFPHKEVLSKGISSGEYTLDYHSNSEVPAKQTLDIHGRRAKFLAKRLLAKELKGAHPERLLNDTESFVSELEKVSDEGINVWSFSIDESSSYKAFEGIKSERILGCLLTVDRRMVSERDWNRLWGKD